MAGGQDTTALALGNEQYVLSPGGHDLALTSHDGRLAIWDAKTQQLKHEFVPSAHLSASCTCIAWMPIVSHTARKRKTSTSSVNGGNTPASHQNGGSQGVVNARSDTLALGTTTGSLLIFSLKTGDVTIHLNKKNAPHKDQVNDIAWRSNCSEVFSVSNDGYISHTNVKKSAVLTRFRGSTKPEGQAVEPLTSVRLHPSESSLVVGSLSLLTWWDLDTKSALKTFAGGHVGSVSSLAIVTSSLNNCYVISGGNNVQKDHTLTVWKLALDDKKAAEDDAVKRTRSGGKKPFAEISAKFSVNESVRAIFLNEAATASSSADQQGKRSRKTSVCEDEEDILFGVVTRSGVLHSFQQNFHGLLGALPGGGAATPVKKQRKPIKPRHTVQIATEKAADGSVGAVPILDARFDANSGVLLAHGSRLAPTFETLETEKMEKLTCLIRSPKPMANNASSGAKADAAASSNLVVPETSGAKVLAPGPSMIDPAAGTKRKAGAGEKDSVSMVDRLRLLSRDAEQKTTAPRTDSMIQLLLQGLHNQDRRILDSVLDRADDELIQNTVKKLPVDGVIPLVQELQHYIKGRGMVNHSHSKWLRCTLQIHTAHLMNSPQCQELLGPIYAMLEARTKHYSTLLQLKGKLDIMTKQIAAKSDPTQVAEEVQSKEALLVYQDDSGDEIADAMDDLLLPPSDTDDHWLMEEDGEGSDDEDEDEDEEDEDDKEEEDDESDDDSEIDLVNGDANMDSD